MKLLIIWLLVSAGAFAHAESVTLDNREAYAIGSSFQWLSTKQSLNIEQVYNNPELNWQTLQGDHTSLGIIRNEHWLRVTLVNRTLNNSWLFQFDSNHLRYLDFWVFHSDGRREHKILGANLPVDTAREFWGPYLNLALDIQPSSQVDIYIRTRHLGQFDVAAKVLPLQQGLANNARNLSLNVLFYGIVLALLVYHLMLFLGVRDKTYLFYSIYLAATLFFLAFIEGFMYLLFDKSIQLTHPVSQTSLIWMGLSSLWFANRFLNYSTRKGWLNKSFWAMTVLGILWMVARPAMTSDIFIAGAMLLLLVSCVYIFVSSWWLGIKEQIDDARIMLLIWSVWLGWVGYLVLGSLNLFPFSLADSWWIFKCLFVAQFLALAWILTLRISEQQQKRELAESQSSAKTELLSRVSHEMRTPLNGIIGVSNMLKQYLTSEEGIKLNAIIQNCGHTLLAVVNDLLEVSRLNKEQFKLIASETRLRPFITEVWRFFEVQIEEKNITPVLYFGDDLPEVVLLDQQRIKQVLTNLLNNSIKYTVEGQIELHVEFENDAVLITVIDTGSGIKAENLEHIFEPFEQLAASDLECRTGTGLGLHITKMLVEKMGGQIGVESEPGKGSRFYVSIPANIVAEPTQVDLNELQPLTERSLMLLVAEDNRVNLLVLKSILKKLGHEFIHCLNGKTAFEHYVQRHQDLDLILMDCEMPVMDGYEATRLIRQFERENGLGQKPIVAVTAHVFEEHFEKIKACGMNHQINKPYTEDDISTALAYFSSADNKDEN